MKLDLSKVNAGTYLPEGESVCRIVKIEGKNSREKNTPMEEVTLRDRLGREDKINLVFTEKALFRVKQLAIAVGFDLEKTNWSQFDTREMMNRPVLVIKTKKGMRTINTEAGPKEVADYDHAFGRAEAAAPAAGGDKPAGDFTEDTIPF